MQTVGQLLKKTREQKQLTLEEIEKKTKIRIRYLEALEVDDYRSLPSAIVAKGFIKNYGNLLELPLTTLLALFRRDFIETDTGQVVPRGIVKPLDRTPTISWTPTRTVVTLVSLVVLIFVAYFIRQLVILGANPGLFVENPKEKEVLAQNLVRVNGKTDPDSTVIVNQQIASVNNEGVFQAVIELPSGQNSILVTATSKSKKSTKLVRTVFVK
ncbi:MAG: hypothetical protein UW69_C0010G0009 [Microgenomates group bacterium GW2011_GWA2_44_7]|nr:MAG: hypothetical protein UW69_C0010G0009 [Microgenomates group bacterium GW2011_GWA2_44_7]KKT78630.1 MAG: hypothetical protein UW73_C0001G0077 [Microgenomates group bacterium GW2011_GWB1_44_8]